jgi:hypothetical protein
MLDITLGAVILHRMNHDTGEWAPSFGLTAMGDEAQATLRDQIDRNRRLKRAQQYKFLAEPAGEVDLACQEILAHPDDIPRFVEQTQRIARHLLASMVPGAQAGDLLACLYDDADDGPWLALLKMQSERAYAEEVSGAVETEDLLYRLNHTMIRRGGVLQKCAFVAPPHARTAHRDLIAYDRQASKTDADDDPVASYFLRGFLRCEAPLSPQRATAQFKLMTARFVRDHADRMGATAVGAIPAAVREAIANREIDVDDFAQRHIPVELHEEYKRALYVQGIPGPIFPSEMAPSPMRPRRLVFAGDYGLKLEIEPEAYARDIRSLEDTVADGIALFEIAPLGGKRRFVISTTRWAPPGRE